MANPPKIIVFKNYLLLILDRNLRTSKYNQTKVTISEKAPYHSIYFGNPLSAPCSIKSKSRTNDADATHTMPNESPILINEPLVGDKRDIPEPKKLIIKLTK